MSAEAIKSRYFRKVIAHPEGAIVHHGDCQTYRVRICTCGLLHDLMAIPTEAAKLYADFPKELADHDWRLEELFSRSSRASKD